jgi:hypothetical protein
MVLRPGETVATGDPLDMELYVSAILGRP